MSRFSAQRLSPHRRDPAATVDDIGVRVLGQRTPSEGRTIVEIELDLPPSPRKPSPITARPVMRPPAPATPRDERRAALAVAGSVLAGFAPASAIGLLIAILL
jgi:hypothetical protein